MGELDKHRTPEEEIVTGERRAVQAAAVRRPSAGLASYFRAALDRLNYLEFGDPSEYLYLKTKLEFPMSPLDSIWVPPRFRQQDDTGEELILDTLLADSNRCVLVLADPGWGKSTLARFLTCFFINRFVQGKQDGFGLFVPLSSLKLSGLTYQEAVIKCATRYVGVDAAPSVLTELQNNFSKACIVFDGFDELPIRRQLSNDREPSPLRREAAQMIRALRYVQPLEAMDESPLKSVVTSRKKDYFEDRESSLGTVPHYFISQFSPNQMNSAVKQWHDAAIARVAESKTRKVLVSAIDDRKRAIQSTLRGNAELASVCLTPLMLSIFQTVYSDNQDVLLNVSHLCWRAVSLFLVEKHAGKSQELFAKENSTWLVDTLLELGWHSQLRFVAGQPKAITNADLRRFAHLVCKSPALVDADYETIEDAVTRLVSFLRRGHGILVRISDDEFDFAHNVFREVLAGRAMGRLPVPERRALALNELWHAPIRYWAGLTADEEHGLHEISAFVGELHPDVRDGNVLASLARGEMLAEVASIVPPSRLTRDLSTRMADVRNELSELLKRKDVSLPHRVRIGDLLGVLPDTPSHNISLNEIAWIEPGSYEIGRATNHRTRIPKYNSCPASPPIKGKLEKFGLASFLVTNQEFRRFIENGGYTNQKYWPNQIAWQWVRGDKNTVASLVEKARGSASTHLSSELAGQRLVPDEIPERCVQMINRKTPLCWVDPAFNRPNQPVVGVNWWEAVAYCLWLEETLIQRQALPSGQHVRLPIEAEWETSAKICGNGNKYPWIDGTPAACAHVRAARLVGSNAPVLRSCAVGLFKFVSTKLPIFDLVGNVWEWTASKSGPYTSDSFRQILDTNGLEDRIARGSSWLSSEEESTEITFRSFDPPYNAYEDLGFRIAIA